MTQVAQSTATVLHVNIGNLGALHKPQWIEVPSPTTSIASDVVGERNSEPQALRQTKSSTLDQLADNLNIQLFIHSTDVSTPVVDDLSVHLDASTAKNEVDRLFSLAMYIDLEPGMENDFSRGLEKLIARHGDPALSEIQSFILEERTKSSIAMEALQYIGRMDSNSWKTERRKLLEQCLLNSRSAWVRDGAGLGLASLDDPRSIGAVKTAIAKESSNSLRKDLESVLEQLEATRSES